MHSGGRRRQIEHELHVSWGREPHSDRVRAQIVEVYTPISLQYVSAFSNDRPGQPDFDEIFVIKVGDLLAVHP